MLTQEKNQLTQLVMFEAARRYLWSLKDSERAYGEQTYRLIENLSTAIENTALSFCTRARFFDDGQLKLEAVQQQGYQACQAYAWLSKKVSLEGQYEMCTILHEQDDRVQTIVRSMQERWINEHQPAPEADTQMD